MRDLATGIAVLATIAALFGLGWYLGRRTEIQRQVDAAFRRETRHRQPAPWPVRGLSAREAMAGGGALSAALRDYGTPVPVNPPSRHRAFSETARGPEWPT